MDKSTLRALTLAIGAAVVGLLLYRLATYWPQINDQAFALLRYAGNLAGGRGPCFNPGEHVEGYTSPLLLLEMTLAMLAVGPVDTPFVAKLASAAGAIAAVLGTWWLCAQWLRQAKPLAPMADILAWTAGALVATNAALAVAGTNGLETTQFAAAIVLGLALLQYEHDRGRWRGSALLFAIATWLRPEGALVFVLVWLGRWIGGEAARNGRKRLGIDAGLVGAAVIAITLTRLGLYDHALPDALFGHNPGGEVAYMVSFARQHLGAWLIVLALAPVVLGGRELVGRTAPALLVLVAGAVGVRLISPLPALGYPLLAPYVPVWAALIVAGLAVVAERTGMARLGGVSAACLVLVGWLWFDQGSVRERYVETVLIDSAGYVDGNIALAAYLREHAQPGETVALRDVGVVGYNCPHLRIVDLTGRHSPLIPGNSATERAARLLASGPDWLVVVNIAPMESQGLDPAKLDRLTPLGDAIVHQSAFAAHYDRPRRPAGRDLLEDAAALLGAERVFLHDFPQLFYLMALYPYHETRPTSAPASVPAPASTQTGASIGDQED